jgi:hypothetical protein
MHGNELNGLQSGLKRIGTFSSVGYPLASEYQIKVFQKD